LLQRDNIVITVLSVILVEQWRNGGWVKLIDSHLSYLGSSSAETHVSYW